MRTQTVDGRAGYVDECRRCGADLAWQPCPTGGWWHHVLHPADHHDAEPGYFPPEEMDVFGHWVTEEPWEGAGG